MTISLKTIDNLVTTTYPDIYSTYTDIKKFNQKLLSDLTDKSNLICKRLHNKKLITEKELKNFSDSLKNASCWSKMYILSKIHKRLFDVPRRPVISNCRNPTGKCVNIFRPPPSTCYKKAFWKKLNI